MQELGKVQALWRYPVKGMGGETVESIRVGDRGLEKDRGWALRDTERAEIQSCKTRPELLRCRAQCLDDGEVEVTFPDGSKLSSADPAMNAHLSELVGRPSTLEPLRPAEDKAFYRRHGTRESFIKDLTATFAREGDEPLPPFLTGSPADVPEFVGIPGTFFLVTPLHLLTSATLAHLESLRPASDWDVRRFRANIVVETPPGVSGLVEQGWVGKRLRVGDLPLDLVDTTVRCSAITRAQDGFGSDPGVLRTVVREADQNAGVYGEAVGSADIRVGDPVWLP
ncbi:MAG: MOSC domain-containing protein [Gammaproteobacteria bacterium]